jgi:hypothetical protein
MLRSFVYRGNDSLALSIWYVMWGQINNPPVFVSLSWLGVRYPGVPSDRIFQHSVSPSKKYFLDTIK